MLGIRYLKVPATTHVIQHKNGSVRREGIGLSFFYFAPSSVITQIPVGSVDVPFAFTEVSSDFQEVTVQGNITYRVAEPAKLAELMYQETADSVAKREQNQLARKMQTFHSPKPENRPDKKQRRELIKFKHQ